MKTLGTVSRLLLASLPLLTGYAHAGLEVTPLGRLTADLSVRDENQGTDKKWRALVDQFSLDERLVVIKQIATDTGGNTSARNNDPLKWKQSGYFQRNRDLGQVFTAERDFTMDAIILRTGTGHAAFLEGMAGAPLFIQFFEVTGDPVIDDNGTPIGKKATHGFSSNHRCDDFVRGVKYTSIRIVRGGRMPDLGRMGDGKFAYMKWDLTGADELRFLKGKRYAFMVGITERGPKRGFTLANRNNASSPKPPSIAADDDTYHGGWGLRREGNGRKRNTIDSTIEPTDPATKKRLASESFFPPRKARFAISPTCDGYPDVDTYRDLEFYIVAKCERDRTTSPNVLLILADDLGNRSLGCFGGLAPTPHLDRLAREGMVFTNAHAAPMCAPTRDEMLTGISRARMGRPDLSIPFFTNDLQKAGYVTGMAGKWFVGRVFDPPRRGFDEALILVNGYRFWAPDAMVFGSGGLFKEMNQPEGSERLNEWEIPLNPERKHHATRLKDRYAEDVSVDFLCDFMERHRDRSFFAYYSSKLTHVPQAPTPDADPREIAAYRRAFLSVDDRKELGQVHARARRILQKSDLGTSDKAYRARGHTYLDKMVGRLVAKLETLGLLEKTVIVFASDNGNSWKDHLPEGAERLPGGKGDCREGGTRIPLIVNWPGRVLAKSTCSDLVHVQDFGPTFLELAGGSIPAERNIDGRSFAPRLFGKPGSPRQWYLGTGAHPSCWLKRVNAEVGLPDREAYKLSWVRGLRYKLYNDGRFYDLEKDLPESKRIPPGEGSSEAESAREHFQTILANIGRFQGE